MKQMRPEWRINGDRKWIIGTNEQIKYIGVVIAILIVVTGWHQSTFTIAVKTFIVIAHS